MGNESKRVALLARPGAAGQRLAEVLTGAGIDVVLQADPTLVDAATVLDARPDTLLVALDAPTEDALDRLGDALDAPSVDVIYEEAALVVAREGWDAARWQRHLLAKLLGHGNVLPPSAGQPEAAPPAEAVAAGAPHATAPVSTSPSDLELPTFGESLSWSLDPVQEQEEAPADADAVLAMPEADAGSLVAEHLELPPLDLPEETPAGNVPDLSLALNPFDPVAAEAGDDVDLGVAGLGTQWTESPAEDASSPLSLSQEEQFKSDLASLELRIASMSLVDDHLPKAVEPARGAVLVLAGIGGPDAVRQLLGGLAPDFAKPVLVQQRLDGARYDRLVAQMQRATSLPVKLAEAGQTAEAGSVYILPDTMGVRAGDTGLIFEVDATDILAALPPAGSAVLLLSGSDPSRVDAALSFGWNGGLVLAQSVDGCYDAAAASELVARGGNVAKPSEMGARLAAQWLR